ncbi:MAG: aspartate racemase, partial [Candidatus Coatesbacteria bacterium]
MTEKIIGVVGGVGPLASIQLIKYIFMQTEATSDQEHLRVAMLSFSDLIP